MHARHRHERRTLSVGIRLALGAAVFGLALACSPDRTPDVPPGTPDCEETCNTAWACAGVLENDLAACLAGCDDEEHGPYRVCIADTPCEEMWECKFLGPPVVEPPEDTGTSTP